MNIKKLCAIFLAGTISATFAQATGMSRWQLEDISNSTGYTVPGNAVSMHQFGMLKHSHICGNDELYLIWSSDTPKVWNLPGQRLAVTASFDGTRVEMPLEVVSIKPVSQDRKLVVLAHVFPNKAVIDLIGQSRQVTVSMPASSAQSGYFDVQQETFSLHGFIEARAKAQWACDQKSI